MADELIDIIDENNQVIGRELKSMAHEKGLRHRAAAVLLQNQEGKYLIVTASGIKVEAGLLFHSAAGHIPAGETYAQAALRELWEETGLSAKKEDVEYLGSFWSEKEFATRIEKERFEIFKIRYLEGMSQIKLNDEQVNGRWLNGEELKSIYLNSPEKLCNPLSLSCRHIFGFSK